MSLFGWYNGKENAVHVQETNKNHVKKTYVLDTNVLLSDPNSIFAFEDNDLIIPLIVLEELDNHKSRPDDVGRNARHVSRTLDDMRVAGNSLMSGVKLPGGGQLKIAFIDETVLTNVPSELRVKKVDNLIIAFMTSLKDTNTILVSKDINVRLKCDCLGVKCEDYLKMRISSDQKDFYRGVEVIEVEENTVDSFFKNNVVGLKDSALNGIRLYPNQIVVLKSVLNGVTNKSAVTKYSVVAEALIPVSKFESVFGLKPRNKEQGFALDLLFDPNVKLLTLAGKAGGGKTIISIAAALEQVKGIGTPGLTIYDKLIVTKPIQPIGKEVGFLPGTLAEKMEPWVAPIRDNLSFLVNNKRPHRARKNVITDNGKPRYDDGTYMSVLQDRGLIEIEAITFIRGRSIPNAFILVDEAQNLTMHELKTIITRAGDGTKIVLTGDLQQIDHSHVDIFTNGLTYAIEKFKEHSIAGHVTLLRGERSPLATLASEIL